jgi:phosphoribosyl-ATP pyrophosphohydrolase
VQIYRAEDIPQVLEELYFEKKVKAIGFTGDDLYDEYVIKNPNTLVSILETIDWDDKKAAYRRPSLRWISRKEEIPKGKVKIAVNKKYEQTSRIAIEEKKEELGIDPEIRVYSGNTEQTVIDGFNDFCIEIVYSGETAKKNNLAVRDKIRFSDFVLIGVNESNPLIFQREYSVISDRVADPREGSYTSNLAADENKAIKKIGEEFAEFMVSLNKEENIPGEFLDLLYTLEVNMAMKGIKLRDITKMMYRRFRK